jgi:hypothetical protein
MKLSLHWILLVVSMKGSNMASAALMDDDDADRPLNWDFHKAHGACMAAAWLALVPMAMFSARFMRKTWPRGWFQIHRGFMMVGLTVATLGLIFILCAHDGKFDVGPHSMLGILAMSFGYLQPVVAFWRPANEINGLRHPRRWVFNWFHRTVGVLAFFLAVVAVFLGCTMLDLAGLPSTLAIPGISIAFIVMSFIIGEIINRVHGLGGYEIPSENPDEELHPIGDDMQTSNLSNYVKVSYYIEFASFSCVI